MCAQCYEQGGAFGPSYLVVVMLSRLSLDKQQTVSARLIDFLARCLLRLQNHKYGGEGGRPRHEL